MMATTLGRVTVTFIVVMYVVFPAVWHYIPAVSRELIFLSFISMPLYFDLNQPEAAGLGATRNIYVDVGDGIELGVWHILPHSYQSYRELPEERYDSFLADGKPVILYLHGNAASRAVDHRVKLYKILRKLDCHVVAFDYAGFADSSPVTVSEESVVRDATGIYKYLRTRVGSSQIIVWGHSLGTGVGSKMAERLCKEGDKPSGLILEAPFTTMKDAVANTLAAKLFNWIPYADQIFYKPLDDYKIIFANELHLTSVDIPILFLHAEDDRSIPLTLGEKLYSVGQLSRPRSFAPMQFIKYKAQHGYGHAGIYKDPGLPDTVTKFIENCRHYQDKIKEVNDETMGHCTSDNCEVNDETMGHCTSENCEVK